MDAGDAPSKFVFLGDYIDRGPDSRGVVEFLIELQSRKPAEIICLVGNHEELALAALRRGTFESHWLLNGGNETLRSYGVTAAADRPPQHIAWFDPPVSTRPYRGKLPGRNRVYPRYPRVSHATGIQPGNH